MSKFDEAVENFTKQLNETIGPKTSPSVPSPSGNMSIKQDPVDGGGAKQDTPTTTNYPDDKSKLDGNTEYILTPELITQVYSSMLNKDGQAPSPQEASEFATKFIQGIENAQIQSASPKMASTTPGQSPVSTAKSDIASATNPNSNVAQSKTADLMAQLAQALKK